MQRKCRNTNAGRSFRTGKEKSPPTLVFHKFFGRAEMLLDKMRVTYLVASYLYCCLLFAKFFFAALYKRLRRNGTEEGNCRDTLVMCPLQVLVHVWFLGKLPFYFS